MSCQKIIFIFKLYVAQNLFCVGFSKTVSIGTYFKKLMKISQRIKICKNIKRVSFKKS